MKLPSFFKNIIFAILFIISMYVYMYHSSKKHIFNEDFHGIVLGKFIDHSTRGTPTVIIDGYKNVEIFNPEYYEMIDSGDYLIKKSGFYKYRLVKHGRDTIVFYTSIIGNIYAHD